MQRSARLYHCARCHCQVVICSHCDRGNVYCTDGCAPRARQESLRRAQQKYQWSRAGRLANARRQQGYRARQRKKVTHQGSAFTPSNDVLPRQENSLLTRRRPSGDVEKNLVFCHFCGGACDVFLRFDFLRRRRQGYLKKEIRIGH